MKMNVPTDLLDKDIKLSSIDGVYVKKYTESVNNKIYTHLEKNLLVFVLKGIKKVKATDYSEIVEEENYIFLKKDNLVMNQILNYVDKNYESLLIFIENKCIYELLKIYDDSDYTNISAAKGYYLGKTSDEMRGEIEKIIQLVNNKEKYNYNIINLKVKELMIYIAQNDKTNEFRNLLKSCIYEKDNFKKFVEENYDKFKGIQEMAQEYSVSLSVFKRKFKAVFNSAPAKWIRNKKLEKASKLLRLTDYNIIEISHIAGFESVSCFNISFKKKYGVTPSKYRKKD